jgi:hypothetical protein
MGNYQHSLNRLGVTHLASGAGFPLRNTARILLLTVLLTALPQVVLPAELDQAAIVRSKSGGRCKVVGPR